MEESLAAVRQRSVPSRFIYSRKNPLRSRNHQPERGVYGDFFAKQERGTRYLDAKTSRWLSADPALGEYIPGAPINDQVKKQNQNLPGMGGVFNYVNMHLYHYAGNNPIKYLDPDGRYLINNVAPNTANARSFASTNNLMNLRGPAFVFQSGTNPPLRIMVQPKLVDNQIMPFNANIQLDSRLTSALNRADSNRDNSTITASAREMENGNFEINVKVEINGRTQAVGTVAFADKREVLNVRGEVDNNKVKQIANETINIAQNTIATTNNIDKVE